MISVVVPDKLLLRRANRKQANTSLEVKESAVVTGAAIKKIINHVLVQISGPSTIMVVETATGTCLAHIGRARGLDTAGVAECHAQLVRQQQLTMVRLGMRGERLEDILVPFRKQLHLIRMAKSGEWFVHLAVKTQDTSLALAREILKSIIP
ncbi:hypothetical protein [Hymenobacter rubidus]|uniref:hypothetical protein n=1 Tax=Hymenobacter rubidus TaxID=1441626 RepID=UPI00191EADB6|nr:hypothetical protein [Hymenobacter rubidus]